MKKPLFVVLLLCALGALLPGVAFPQPPTPMPAAAGTKQLLPLILRGAGVSANDSVPAYNAAFQYGINPGYFGNGWSDEDIHQLCYDAGCRSARATRCPTRLLASGAPTSASISINISPRI